MWSKSKLCIPANNDREKKLHLMGISNRNVKDERHKTLQIQRGFKLKGPLSRDCFIVKA